MSTSPTVEAAPVALPFRQPKPVLRILGVVLSLAGWLLSLYLVGVTIGGVTDRSAIAALCGGAEASASGWNCRSVLASSYGSVALDRGGGFRIPVATLGLVYFGFLAVWYLFVGSPTRSRAAWHLVPVITVIIGGFASYQYVLIMADELRQFCGGCLAVHAVNALLVIVTVFAWPFRKPRTPIRPHPAMRLGVATALAAMLMAVLPLSLVVSALASSRLDQIGRAYTAIVDDPAYVAWRYERQPVVQFPEDTVPPLLGDAAAANTVVIFSDAQCPRCRDAHRKLEQIVAAYPGRVRVFFRHYPLDPACNDNPRYRAGGHPSACRMAQVIEAARALGGNEAAAKAVNFLHARLSRLDAMQAEAVATELGLPVEPFVTFVREARSPRVAEDIALAHSIGLQDTPGVPVVYLNGRRLDGWSNDAAWESLLK